MCVVHFDAFVEPSAGVLRAAAQRAGQGPAAEDLGPRRQGKIARTRRSGRTAEAGVQPQAAAGDLLLIRD